MKSISWSKNIPFFKNTFIFRSILLVYLTVILLMSIFLVVLYGIEGDLNQLSSMILPMLGIYLLIFVLFLFSTWVVLGNKYSLDYTIDEEGILITGTQDKSGDIRKLALSVGIITGNPTVAGSGLLVKENVIFIPWKKVDNIKIEQRKHRLEVKCSFWTQVALHYPEELAEEIENLVEEYSYKNHYDV